MNVYFCFPYRGVGGVSLLFLRLGTYLAEQGHEVILIDYPDGYMARHLDASKVTLVPYSDKGPVEVPADAILVLQAMNPWSVFPGLHVDPATRLIFWYCMPFNLVPALPGMRERSYRNPVLLAAVLSTFLAKRRAINRSLVNTMHAKHSLFFMDEENLAIAERFLGTSLKNPIFVPIPSLPVEAGVPAMNDGANGQRPLRLVWVGRLADFKYPILERALRDLEDLARGVEVNVTIVGSGPYERPLTEHARRLSGVSTRFVREVAPSDLPAFLRAECDIAICMGTAALDCARLGIPTVLLDASYGPVDSQYRYRWLFEEHGYTLGRILFEPASYPPGRDLGALLEEFRLDRGALRERTLTYFEANHALPSVGANFISRLAKASYLWADFVASGAGKRDLAYRLLVGFRKLLGRVRA